MGDFGYKVTHFYSNCKNSRLFFLINSHKKLKIDMNLETGISIGMPV